MITHNFHVLYFRWEGKDVNEVGKDKATGIVRVKINPKFYRPTEVVSFGFSFDFFCPGIHLL